MSTDPDLEKLNPADWIFIILFVTVLITVEAKYHFYNNFMESLFTRVWIP
jgi:hypothetical protein